MPGKKSKLTLEVRKQLLLAESELNRAQFQREWDNVEADGRAIADSAKAVVTRITSTVSMGIAGVKAFQELRGAQKGKPSWIATAINGARLGASLWKAFKS